MKKLTFILVLTVLMISMMSMTALAHGHGRGHKAVQQPRYTACTVDGCTLPDLHKHNGTYYYCASHSTAHGYGHRR